MKKFKLLLSLSILFFAFYSCNEQLEITGQESIDSKRPITKPFTAIYDDSEIDYCGVPVECDLVAGQSINAGLVTIMNDDEYLYVKVYSEAGFQDVEENIKMWIGTEIPSKRPPAGHFPYKVTESGDTHIFQIKLSDLEDVWDGECGLNNSDPLIIIVHADVLTTSDGGQTAFGGCIDADTKGAWWYYMEYKVQCCEENPETTLGWLYKTTNPDLFVTCINDEGDYGYSNEIHYEWLKRVTTEDRIKYYPIYTNSKEGCDDRDELGYVGLKIYTDLDGDDAIKFYVKTKVGYTNVKYNIYVGWDNPVVNIDELNPSVLFESGNLPNDTDLVSSVVLEKKVSDWSGMRLFVDEEGNPITNSPFYVIVKLTQIE